MRFTKIQALSLLLAALTVASLPGWPATSKEASKPSAADTATFKAMANTSKAHWVEIPDERRKIYIDTAKLAHRGNHNPLAVRIKELHVPDPAKQSRELYYIARMGVDCKKQQISSPSHILFFNPTNQVVNSSGPLAMTWTSAEKATGGKSLWNIVCK